ncbi:MAG: hypothetical protein IJ068_01785 [Bacilli bacterium]|nr:hypothetical protein [Bacilli bacterium]
MANLEQVKQACNTAKEFYEDKNELITKAYKCCVANRCSKVKESVDDLKSNIESLKSKISEWHDSAGSSFGNGIASCVDILATISSSIETSWTNAEKLYESNNETLNFIKNQTNYLEGKINAYPNKNSSEFYDSHYNPETKTYEKKFNRSKYESKVKEWEQSCDPYVNGLKTNQEIITNNLTQLEAINGESISVKANINSIEESNKNILALANKAVLIPALGMEIFPGQKVEIDDEIALMKFINMCYQEQGSEKGIAFQASQVINRFKYQTGEEPLTISELATFMSTPVNKPNSCRNGKLSWYGWYGGATTKKYSLDYYDLDDMEVDKGIAIVTEVLNGNHVLPDYITEHDDFDDITKITPGKKGNRSDYIQDVTVIHNKYESKGEPGFIFYAFPYSDSGDPFGYKNSYKEELDNKKS